MTEKTSPLMQIRERLLKDGPTDKSMKARGAVLGVLMETGMPGGFATIVALSDGTVSLYTSTGGGVIGGGGHEAVAAAAGRLCDLADRLLDGLSPTTEFPPPGVGRIRFYVLTTTNVRTADIDAAVLRAPGHALHGLFVASHEVITQLRMVSQGFPKDRASN